MRRVSMTLEAGGIQFDVFARHEPYDDTVWIDRVELDGVNLFEVLDDAIINELEQQAWRDVTRG